MSYSGFTWWPKKFDLFPFALILNVITSISYILMTLYDCSEIIMNSHCACFKPKKKNTKKQISSEEKQYSQYKQNHKQENYYEDSTADDAEDDDVTMSSTIAEDESYLPMSSADKIAARKFIFPLE